MFDSQALGSVLCADSRAVPYFPGMYVTLYGNLEVIQQPRHRTSHFIDEEIL